MKELFILIFFISCSAYSQSEGLIEYRKQREQRKKDIEKDRNEYTGQDGITYELGDTLIIQPKLSTYKGIYFGYGVANLNLDTQFKQKHDPKELYFVIKRFKKETVAGNLIVSAFCKGINKKGRFTVFIDKASLNCEIRECE
ncbi:MAG: hypothetical protein ACI9Y7_002048 [Dokdonia sp.]|jgi:hypothetical protein